MKIEIIPCILSDHNALKLEFNNKNNSRKHANNWKLFSALHPSLRSFVHHPTITIMKQVLFYDLHEEKRSF
jgi:hypothetical protein